LQLDTLCAAYQDLLYSGTGSAWCSLLPGLEACCDTWRIASLEVVVTCNVYMVPEWLTHDVFTYIYDAGWEHHTT